MRPVSDSPYVAHYSEETLSFDGIKYDTSLSLSLSLPLSLSPSPSLSLSLSLSPSPSLSLSVCVSLSLSFSLSLIWCCSLHMCWSVWAHRSPLTVFGCYLSDEPSIYHWPLLLALPVCLPACCLPLHVRL
jgi:hypothetical protein